MAFKPERVVSHHSVLRSHRSSSILSTAQPVSNRCCSNGKGKAVFWQFMMVSDGVCKHQSYSYICIFSGTQPVDSVSLAHMFNKNGFPLYDLQIQRQPERVLPRMSSTFLCNDLGLAYRKWLPPCMWRSGITLDMVSLFSTNKIRAAKDCFGNQTGDVVRCNVGKVRQLVLIRAGTYVSYNDLYDLVCAPTSRAW